MFPTFKLFGIEFTSYTFVPIVGLIVATIVFCLRAKHYQYSWKKAFWFGLLFAPAWLLGSKVMYLLAYYPRSIEILKAGSGADSWGVFFLFPALVWMFAKIAKQNFRRTLDCFVPGLCVAFVFAQIACYMNGCCVGIQVAEWRIPVQLLEACFGFSLLMYLLYRDETEQGNGNLYLVALLLHGLYRLLADFVRDSDKELLLSRGQWLAVLSIMIGIFLLRKEINAHESE